MSQFVFVVDIYIYDLTYIYVKNDKTNIHQKYIYMWQMAMREDEQTRR